MKSSLDSTPLVVNTWLISWMFFGWLNGGARTEKSTRLADKMYNKMQQSMDKNIFEFFFCRVCFMRSFLAAQIYGGLWLTYKLLRIRKYYANRNAGDKGGLVGSTCLLIASVCRKGVWNIYYYFVCLAESSVHMRPTEKKNNGWVISFFSSLHIVRSAAHGAYVMLWSKPERFHFTFESFMMAMTDHEKYTYFCVMCLIA